MQTTTHTTHSRCDQLPKITYLNEPLVNQQTQLLEEDEVEHCVEEYGESEETSTG